MITLRFWSFPEDRRPLAPPPKATPSSYLVPGQRSWWFPKDRRQLEHRSRESDRRRVRPPVLLHRPRYNALLVSVFDLHALRWALCLATSVRGNWSSCLRWLSLIFLLFTHRHLIRSLCNMRQYWFIFRSLLIDLGKYAVRYSSSKILESRVLKWRRNCVDNVTDIL